MAIIFNRKWCMPNKFTFEITPIKQLIYKYTNGGKGWIDPFANNSKMAEITNDLNPNTRALYHLPATDFIKELKDQYEGVLFDPPYSSRQIKEVYESIDIENSFENTQGSFWSTPKDLIAPKIKPGGYAICFGWNSNGFGRNRGFKMIEILLVAHGGAHYDTIVTVERKFTNSLF